MGVDASTGVASQSDPLPVVLRITGPARSVMRGNRLLTTDITGCLVNGAARGDLSAEKVYVKLVRMTCAQPGGRFAVSEVKGFISFAGKSGVRGRVVSREGSLVSQALLAGIVGGFGRGFSANANGIFTGQVGANGQREALSPTDILAGGFGQGAGEAADTVMLHSLGLHAQELRPGGLLALIDELTSPTTAHETDIHAWNPHDTLDVQAIRRDIELEVGDDRLILRTERFRETGRDEDGNPEVGECYPDHFDVRHYAVRSTPERWAPWECARLIGDMFTDKLRFPCPTASMLCLVYPDQEAASARAGFKFMRTTSLSQTKSARFLPKLAEQSAEWRHVQAELQAGKKLVKLFYGLTSISPLGQGDAHERIIKAIYKAAGWDLADERFLQLQGLVAAFPLSLADGLADDMARLKRLKTMLSTTAAHIAPMQGEYLGGVIPHLLLVGRRGQPFWWSPFENTAGNHNIAICGKSGSGKSVLLQELCAALRGAGAKVVVIDDGRSFEHSVKLQGGRFVEFTLASGFSLNPFSMVDDARAHEDEDYRLDCFAMIKAIVGQMARPGTAPSDTERGLIDRAVTATWEALGSGASVDDVAHALHGSESEAASICQRHVGAFSSGPLRNGLKRPTKVSGTPENRRDDPERSKGQIPRISAGFIDYLGEREKNKWCPEEDSNLHALASAST